MTRAVAKLAILFLAVCRAAPAPQPPRVVIDYPEDASIFPPDFAPPTFLWRDAQSSAWEIEIAFSDGAPAIRRTARGEPMRIGESTRAASPTPTNCRL